MTYGGSPMGSSTLGSLPEPNEFENQSDEEKNESYAKLYDKMEDLEEKLEENSEAAENWRRKSWFWRLGSFVGGLVLGTLL